ncbi:hypothetical protein [Actinoplanes sp. NPDC051411]|uniref:hypothetical protein n=1 Tax=Actinoplanes sp. NPDC051411 TaxID=3155522 RepID=UPI00343D5E05
MTTTDQRPPFWSAAEAEVWRRLFDATLGPAVPSDLDEAAAPVFELPVPPGAGPVEAAIGVRASRRDLAGPVRPDALATVLRGLHRPGRPGEPSVPRSGGLAALTPYLSAVDVIGLPVGLYRSDGRRLVRAQAPGDWPERAGRHINLYLGRAGQDPPPAVLLWRVQWRPVMTRYPCCGLLTAFWDAGVALQAAGLLAEEAGLAGCACAGLPPADLVTELGWSPWERAFVGALALGNPDSSGTNN